MMICISVAILQHVWPVAIASLAAYVAMAAAFVPVYGAFGERRLYAPLAGLANGLMIAILVNSAYRNLSGRGVEWKGQRVSTLTPS